MRAEQRSGACDVAFTDSLDDGGVLGVGTSMVGHAADVSAVYPARLIPVHLKKLDELVVVASAGKRAMEFAVQFVVPCAAGLAGEFCIDLGEFRGERLERVACEFDRRCFQRP